MTTDTVMKASRLASPLPLSVFGGHIHPARPFGAEVWSRYVEPRRYCRTDIPPKPACPAVDATFCTDRFLAAPSRSSIMTGAVVPAKFGSDSRNHSV